MVNRAEFLDVERGVIDAHELPGIGIAKEREVSQAGEESGVVECRLGEWSERAGVKEITAERLDAERTTGAGFIEQAEDRAQCGPSIGVPVITEVSLFCHAAQSGETVVRVVNTAQTSRSARRVHEVAFLDDHEKQQSIHETQKLLVKARGEIRLFGGYLPEGFIPRVI